MDAPSADLILGPGLTIPAAEIRWRFCRASGPGGQNVNSNDTRVMLVFDLAGSAALPEPLQRRALRRLGPRLVAGQLQISAQEHRSQWRNRQAARERLMAVLQEAIAPPPPPRRATRPGRAAVERRLAAKRQRAQLKGQRRSRRAIPDD